MQLVISDHHLGLKAVIASAVVGSAWQRCRVHFMRNVLARVPKASAEMVAASIRTMFAQPDTAHVRAQLVEVAGMLRPQFPDVVALLLDAGEDMLAFTPTLTSATGARSGPPPITAAATRAARTPHGEIKRRTNVAWIFPSEASVLRRITAVVVDTHDEWQVAERRYLSEESLAKLHTTRQTDPEPLPEAPLAVTA